MSPAAPKKPRRRPPTLPTAPAAPTNVPQAISLNLTRAHQSLAALFDAHAAGTHPLDAAEVSRLAGALRHLAQAAKLEAERVRMLADGDARAAGTVALDIERLHEALAAIGLSLPTLDAALPATDDAPS